jgi:hypothetical protein
MARVRYGDVAVGAGALGAGVGAFGLCAGRTPTRLKYSVGMCQDSERSSAEECAEVSFQACQLGSHKGRQESIEALAVLLTPLG